MFINTLSKGQSFRKVLELPEITRNTYSISPVRSINIAGSNIPTLYGTNDIVKNGDMVYVGSQDSEAYEFDFSTKAVNSVAMCPMKIYRGYGATFYTPTQITGDRNNGFEEFIEQTVIDKLKTQDGTHIGGSASTSTSGKYAQIMVELDLTSLCNMKYAYNSTSMIADILSILTDVWAMGHGSNAGAEAYGVTYKWWNMSTKAWVASVTNTSSSIAKMTNSASTTTSPNYIDNNCKMFWLIHATYPSNGTITSYVGLDYTKTTISIKRGADVVIPQQIELPRCWAILVKGFSPSWDSAVNSKAVFYIGGTGTGNIRSYIQNGLLYFQRYDNANTYINGTSMNLTNLKYQCINLLYVITQDTLEIRFLKNNDVVNKKVVTKIGQDVTGLLDLYIGSYPNSSKQSDAFFESFTFFDLSKFSNGFSDAGAEALLRGQEYSEVNNYAKVPHMPAKNICDNGDFTQPIDVKWVLIATDDSIENNKLVKRATAARKTTTQIMDASPNMTYTVKVTKTGKNGFLNVSDVDSGTILVANVGMSSEGDFESSFTTLNTTTSIKVLLSSASIGLFTFSNISIKGSDGVELVQNGDFSTNFTWTLSPTSRIENGQLITTSYDTTSNATSNINIPVLPNNRYAVSGTINGDSGGRIGIIQYSGNALISSTIYIYDNNVHEFTTGANINKIRITLSKDSTAAGTFIYSNISLIRLD